ncbi:hypothetical protein RQP46_001360 [Phenoliferia psychrophenolica]
MAPSAADPEWLAEKIVSGRPGAYIIQWSGTDENGNPWPNSQGIPNAALKAAWKEEKERERQLKLDQKREIKAKANGSLDDGAGAVGRTGSAAKPLTSGRLDLDVIPIIARILAQPPDGNYYRRLNEYAENERALSALALASHECHRASRSARMTHLRITWRKRTLEKLFAVLNKNRGLAARVQSIEVTFNTWDDLFKDFCRRNEELCDDLLDDDIHPSAYFNGDDTESAWVYSARGYLKATNVFLEFIRKLPGVKSLHMLNTLVVPDISDRMDASRRLARQFARLEDFKTAVVGKTGLVITDSIGNTLNHITESAGSERWFPTSGDMPQDLAKATRIFESFTVDGTTTATKGGVATLRKIPAQIIRDAKGICVYSAMRNGIPPFGGSNGSGVVVARLPDGFMVGIDIFDAVLIIRTEEALLSFTSRVKMALGTDFAVVAGPYGAGAALDLALKSPLNAPILSYVKSRGLYAGIHLSGQIFVERQHENSLLYCYPGVRAAEILEGKIKIPDYARVHFINLHMALYNAESGEAQRRKGGKDAEDKRHVKETEIPELEKLLHETELLELDDGERLHLPPTPDEIDREEEEKVKVELAKRGSWLGWLGKGQVAGKA